MASGKRILIGCALGCGGALLLVLAAAVSFGVWLKRPGELLEPERLLGARTSAYLEWTLELEDPGTAGFVDSLIELIHETSEDSDGPFPPWINDWLRHQQRSSTERDLRALFPLVAAWIRDGEGARDGQLEVVTLSLESVGNQLVLLDFVLGWILGRDERSSVERHRDERIYGFPWGTGSTVTLFIRGNDLFFAPDVAAARNAVDRLLEPGAAPDETTELSRLFAATAGGSNPLRGALINRRGELCDVGESIGLDPAWLQPWCAVDSLRVAGGLRASGSLSGTLIAAGHGTWAADNARGLAGELTSGLAETGLSATVVPTVRGDELHLDVVIVDLVDWLERLDE